MEVATEFVTGKNAVLTAFGVDLLYPGLDLEIDAMAIIDPERKRLAKSVAGGAYQPNDYSDGVSAAGEIFVGGQVALGDDGTVLAPGNPGEQARIVFERLASVLATDSATLDDVVKLNIFFVAEDGETPETFAAVSAAWTNVAPNAHPAMTPVRVHELARDGLLVQADCIALQ